MSHVYKNRRRGESRSWRAGYRDGARRGWRPDCRRYLKEVQERGKPADATGYR